MEASEVLADQLTVGWPRIGPAVGRSARYMAQAHSEGRLPFAPLHIGRHVAMTPDMIDRMKAALAERAATHVARNLRASDEAS